MKRLCLVPLFLFAGQFCQASPASSGSQTVQAEPAKTEVAERRTVIGILHPSDIGERADKIQLHLVSIKDVTEGLFVVDVALESPLTRKQVDLMTQRVRLAGEDKVRRVLLKLSALVEDAEPPKITKACIIGFKARKDAELAGGAVEETLVGDWPDVGFIAFPPEDKEGAGSKEKP
jgi:hypothetical protein